MSSQSPNRAPAAAAVVGTYFGLALAWALAFLAIGFRIFEGEPTNRSPLATMFVYGWSLTPLICMMGVLVVGLWRVGLIWAAFVFVVSAALEGAGVVSENDLGLLVRVTSPFLVLAASALIGHRTCAGADPLTADGPPDDGP